MIHCKAWQLGTALAGAQPSVSEWPPTSHKQDGTVTRENCRLGADATIERLMVLGSLSSGPPSRADCHGRGRRRQKQRQNEGEKVPKHIEGAVSSADKDVMLNVASLSWILDLTTMD